MSTDPAPAPQAARPRRGAVHRAGLILVAALSVAFATVCTTQIVLAVWFPPEPPWDVSCREGLKGLIGAVERARANAAAEAGGERRALLGFRESLEPEWSRAATVRSLCRNDPPAMKALRTIELLRYAEERAVRYEALDLSRLRQRVPALRRELSL